MKTLAIETSCDDTSIGIVEYKDGVFSCPILKAYSQITEHQQYGGVVPEIAYRLHEEKILEIIREIWYDVIAECDFITVTKEPGLPWALVVGNTVATMLWLFLNKPVYRVNHIYGHIFSLLLDRSFEDLPFPRIILTASGGHNELYYANAPKLQSSKVTISEEKGTEALKHLSIGALEISKLGYSLDDAAGESFDKVSRMLGGPNPGGPWISQKAESWTANQRRKFKRILLDGKGTNMKQELIDQNINNFSFSGMKSQVYQLLQKDPLETLSEQDICDICREFQECVTDILSAKLLHAALEYETKTIGLVWGVSANDRLFEKTSDVIHSPEFSAKQGMVYNCFRPNKKVYSTDNAAMIGVVWILEHLQLL